MAKFNATKTEPTAVNVAGGNAYERKNLKQEIASIVLNSLLAGDSYYEKETDRIDKVFELVNSSADGDAEFLAKTAIYTRTVGNLRSITHVLGTAIAERYRELPFLRRAYSRMIVRPDDMLEIVALWNSRNKKQIPNALRRALKDILEEKRFDEFQLRRYRGNGAVKLKNIIMLAHPKKNLRLYKKVLDDKLKPIETMETMRGEKGTAKTFTQLLKEKKLGYMAALKNIRNAVAEGIDDETIALWCDYMSNEKAVLKSRVLPFRFWDAWQAISDSPIDRFKLNPIKEALGKALTYSAKNLEFVEGDEKIAVVLDESGSMTGGWYSDSSHVPFDIGKVLAFSLMSGLPQGQVVFYTFSNNCTDHTGDIGGNVIDAMGRLKAFAGATYFNAPFEQLIRTNTFVDKIVILTDMQLYQADSGYTSFTAYLNQYRSISPKVKVLFWNIEGYGGATPLNFSKDVLEISGFSSNMLKIIPKVWKNELALIDEIEAVEI